ncbi:hypothetical protein V2J56_09145 [Georgenia sp. MJ206]|uniref:VG15 protein n=1 Tax=Georgenia wangjunii TaxID=3117730 RepID=UPI002F26DC30
MAELPPAVGLHYREMAVLQSTALAAGRRAWRGITPARLSESWTELLTPLERTIRATQESAALEGAAYGALTLAQQGVYEPPQAFANPKAWSQGHAPDGRALAGLLYSPITAVKSRIAGGMPVSVALAQGRKHLDTFLTTIVADAGRQAASVDIAARSDVGWVRMVSPGACSRCLILAGRWFRYNEGFLRHPKCMCTHVMTKAGSLEMAKEAGLVDDPYEHFRSLSDAEQNRIYGEFDAQAIRDGGDIYQVVNARRGRNGLTTSEGTSRRGNARRTGAERGQRLTPEGIYRQTTSQEQALQLLERNGYILPGGQQPGGVLRGTAEGWGALGRGGTRVGARGAAERARTTGVRDPASRYTMTEAERRLTDSRLRWDAVRQGRNPYSRDGRGLTPDIAATVETDYRRWLASGGQIFTR